jgi:hypothetical protein
MYYGTTYGIPGKGTKQLQKTRLNISLDLFFVKEIKCFVTTTIE